MTKTIKTNKTNVASVKDPVYVLLRGRFSLNNFSGRDAADDGLGDGKDERKTEGVILVSRVLTSGVAVEREGQWRWKEDVV